MGAPEIGIIAAVIILLFGARKLPELAGSLGKSIKEFRKESKDALSDDEPTTTTGTGATGTTGAAGTTADDEV